MVPLGFHTHTHTRKESNRVAAAAAVARGKVALHPPAYSQLVSLGLVSGVDGVSLAQARVRGHNGIVFARHTQHSATRGKGAGKGGADEKERAKKTSGRAGACVLERACWSVCWGERACVEECACFEECIGVCVLGRMSVSSVVELLKCVVSVTVR